ncbi:MAG: hypothetical protein U0V72_00655 [Cytophagales bacterium]
MTTQEALALADVFLKQGRAKTYHCTHKTLSLKPNKYVSYFENGHTIILSCDNAIMVDSDVAIYANTAIEGVESKAEIHAGNVSITNNSTQTADIKLLNIKYN